MFGRYTVRARRVIFFARYEASELGGLSIEPEHLLLGLVREDPDVFETLISSGDSLESLREEVTKKAQTGHPNVSTSAEMPLDNSSKRALTYAAEEADRLLSQSIDSRHILLGLLRTEGTPACEVLRQHGLKIDRVRDHFAGDPTPPPGPPASSSTIKMSGWFVSGPETARRILVAVLTPIVGQEAVDSQKPFQASLGNGVWTVRGTVPEGSDAKPFVGKILRATGEIVDLDPRP